MKVLMVSQQLKEPHEMSDLVLFINVWSEHMKNSHRKPPNWICKLIFRTLERPLKQFSSSVEVAEQ